MSGKILVVDDTMDMLELLRVYFTYEGYSVIVAADGAEGLYLTKAEKPDLVITDITMPNMDGTTMIRELRSDPETAALPIIALTGCGQEQLGLAKQAGANDARTKTMDLSELAGLVGGFLSSKQP